MEEKQAEELLIPMSSGKFAYFVFFCFAIQINKILHIFKNVS